jgi:alpha,alpha-trehalase
LNERSWKMVVAAVETVLGCWRQADQSIRETRADPQHFTYSKVMCWVAADRGARLAALRGDTARAERWWNAAMEIHR